MEENKNNQNANLGNAQRPTPSVSPQQRVGQPSKNVATTPRQNVQPSQPRPTPQMTNKNPQQPPKNNVSSAPKPSAQQTNQRLVPMPVRPQNNVAKDSVQNKGPRTNTSNNAKKDDDEAKKGPSRAFYVVVIFMILALVAFTIFYLVSKPGEEKVKIIDADFKVDYNYSSVSFEASAFYQKENDEAFTYLVNNGNNLISVESNASNGYSSLKSSGNVELADNNKYVIFGYSFKNKSSTYDIRVSLSDYLLSDSVYVNFYVSDLKYQPANIAEQKALINGNSVGKVSILAGSTKYFYVLVEKKPSAKPLNYAVQDDNSISWNIESTVLVNGETPLNFFNVKNNQIYSVATGKTLDKEVVIPSSVSGIMNNAFENNQNIESVTIHNGIQGIGWNAFAGSTLSSAIFKNTDNWYVTNSYVNENISISLSNPTISAMMLTSSYNSEDTSNIGYADSYWTKTSSTTAPTSYSTLHISQHKIQNFLAGNTGIVNVVNVVIPYGVTQIGSYAFAGLSANPNNTLRYISIPDSMEVISDFAFYKCDALNAYNYSDCKYLGNIYNPCLVLYKAETTATSFEIPTGTKFIYEEAFMDNSSITNISIPTNVASICRNAFKSMSVLRSVAFGEGLETIGDYGFNACSSLKSIELPSTLKVLGSLAFGGCSGLNYIKLNSINPPTISDPAFGSNDYTPILVPNDSLNVYKTTYSGYSTRIYSEDMVSNNFLCVTEGITKKLVKYLGEQLNVIVPSDVTIIEHHAFYNNSTVQSIYVPNISLSSIGNSAFVGCSVLTTLTITATIPPTLGENVFDGITSHLTIYVPQSSLDDYRNNSSYSSMASIIQAI